MRDLRDEAFYINKLDRMLNGQEPKAEKEKQKRNQQITALQTKIKELQKELPPTESELKKKIEYRFSEPDFLTKVSKNSKDED
jgi:vacuolar-type H+-ATPase subunit I/STV1